MLTGMQLFPCRQNPLCFFCVLNPYSRILFYFSFQFMDLTSLQATLPDPHVPTENTGNLTGSWISQNSSVPYIPSASQGICLFTPDWSSCTSTRTQKFSLLIHYLILLLIQEGCHTWQDSHMFACQIDCVYCNCSSNLCLQWGSFCLAWSRLAVAC